MKFLKKAFEHIKDSFVACAVLLDESKRINEDGSWDKYWERKNRKKGVKKDV